MTRVKRGYVARKRRKNIFTLTAGFQGAHSKLFRTANQQGMRALASSYRDRNKRKRDLRIIESSDEQASNEGYMEISILSFREKTIWRNNCDYAHKN